MRSAEATFFDLDAHYQYGSEDSTKSESTKELPYGVAMPDHVIQLPYGDGVAMLVPNKDGSLLYAGAYQQSLDFGRIIDDYFHWWSMPIAAIVLIVAAWRVVRAMQRPQQRGQSYCQKCNYNLAGITQNKCPECGVDVARYPATLGKTLFRRRWLAIPLVIICVVFLSVAWWTIPRVGLQLFSRLDVCSADVLQKLEAKGYAVPRKWKKAHTVVIAVDPVTGRWLYLYRMPVFYFRTPPRTPDGLGVFLADGKRGASNTRIYDIELATGRVRRSVALPPNCEVGPYTRTFVAGFSDDQSEVLIHFVNNTRMSNVLAAWNIKTNQLRELTEFPAFVDPTYGTVHGRKILKVPGEGPVKFIAHPVFPETFTSESYPVSFFDEKGSILASVDLGVTVGSNTEACLSCDGTSLFLSTDYRSRDQYVATDRVQRYEIARLLSGDVQPASGVDTRFGVWYQTIMNTNDSLLFANTNNEVFIRDMTKRSWRAFLRVTDGHVGPHDIVVSPDSSWVAAQTRIDYSTSSTYYLTIWKVPTVPPGRPPIPK